MQLICRHDPADPNHLICETKHSPLAQWLRARYRRFYCVGPDCPPHQAYTHLAVDVILVAVVAALLVSNMWLAATGRRIEQEQTWEERVKRVANAPVSATPSRVENGELQPGSVSIPEQPALRLEAEAAYFSASGEQLGRGPWPPKAGESTMVKVFLKPIIAGAIDSVVVSGVLGPAARWTGFAPLGRGLFYVPESRTVFWEPSDPEARALFEVAITPSPSDLSSGAILILTDLQISGFEKATSVHHKTSAPHVIVEIGGAPGVP